MKDLKTAYEKQRSARLQAVSEDHEEKIQECLRQLRETPTASGLYKKIAIHQSALRRHAESLETLSRGINNCPQAADLRKAQIRRLEACNRTQAAIEAAEIAMQKFPEEVWFKMQASLLLPVVYSSPAEISYYRNRYSQGLLALESLLSKDPIDPDWCRRAWLATARHSNFYLAYQGHNDKELQERYGSFIHRLAKINLPACSEPVSMPPLDGHLRVGYVSSCFRDHVSKYFLGWLRGHDHNRFRTYAYSIGSQRAHINEETIACAGQYVEIGTDLEASCRAIRADNLHVLIFLDVGMETPIGQLAALRLAPIQCVTWGHPETTGLPTLDYFISSELTEPPDGQENYSERLVKLPGIGVSYRRPLIPKPLLNKERSDFGLGQESTLFVCSQPAFKYLPQHDDIFPLIANRLRTAEFVFFTHNDYAAADFRRRLDDAFSKVGLSAAAHCRFLPLQDWFAYLNITLLADVFLDSLEYSGGNTTMEAIACGLPVVTLPGKLMRGRQSAAILTQLGIEDTIARNKAHYVDIAVQLGQSAHKRSELRAEIIRNHTRLYSDSKPVSALETFLWSAVEERLRA